MTCNKHKVLQVYITYNKISSWVLKIHLFKSILSTAFLFLFFCLIFYLSSDRIVLYFLTGHLEHYKKLATTAVILNLKAWKHIALPGIWNRILPFLSTNHLKPKNRRPITRQYFFSNVWKTIASHWKLKTNTACKDWHFFISNKEDTTAVKKFLDHWI